jgi:hypothetical protein
MFLDATQLALQRKRYSHLTDEEFRFMLQQVDGRQRTKEKLPTFAKIDDWWYPVRLSCEQCSSEITAQHKAKLIGGNITKGEGEEKKMIDLTGGYGVDTYFMSKYFNHVHYVERNAELCRIAAHNFSLTSPHICIHNTTAETFLNTYNEEKADIVFLDPARRDQNGGKVFRLEECEPNVVHLLPALHATAQKIAIKLSPMLDITAALHALEGAWNVHIVAVKNEVKEVLLIQAETTSTIHATNLLPACYSAEQQDFIFTNEEEKNAHCILYSESDTTLNEKETYIYEPNAAIIKAGAYKLIAQRFELCKMAQHTHLYLANKLIENFPGRRWKIITTNPKDTKNIRANILTRNYPLTPEQLRKKLKIKDSDTHTIIGARLADKPTLFLCEKV